MSTPSSPGGLSRLSAYGSLVARDELRAAGAEVRCAQRRQVFDDAEEVRVADDQRRRCRRLSALARQRCGVGATVGTERAAITMACGLAHAREVRVDGLEVLRVQALGDQHALRLRVQRRAISTASAAALAPSYIEALATSRPNS